MAKVIDNCEFEEIIYTRLNESEDVLHAIWSLAREHDVKAGIVLEGTGALQNIVFQRPVKNEKTCKLKNEIYELKGPIQANVRGMIGITAEGDDKCYGFCPEKDIIPGLIENELDWLQYSGSEGGVGTPFFDGNFSIVNKEVSVMGRLLPGTKVENPGMGRDNKPTHFTLVIGKLKNRELRIKYNKNGLSREFI